MGARTDLKLPQIFRVNWFRKDANGKFIWPGFGQNMRVLKWILDRVHGRVAAEDSPFGRQPRHEDITWQGLEFTRAQFDSITEINKTGAMAEVEEIKGYFAGFGDRLPAELEAERQKLADRVSGAPDVWKLTA